jgi:multimeric flavodoxin WrbA
VRRQLKLSDRSTLANSENHKSIQPSLLFFFCFFFFFFDACIHKCSRAHAHAHTPSHANQYASTNVTEISTRSHIYITANDILSDIVVVKRLVLVGQVWNRKREMRINVRTDRESVTHRAHEGDCTPILHIGEKYARITRSQRIFMRKFKGMGETRRWQVYVYYKCAELMH